MNAAAIRPVFVFAVGSAEAERSWYKRIAVLLAQSMYRMKEMRGKIILLTTHTRKKPEYTGKNNNV